MSIQKNEFINSTGLENDLHKSLSTPQNSSQQPTIASSSNLFSNASHQNLSESITEAHQDRLVNNNLGDVKCLANSQQVWV